MKRTAFLLGAASGLAVVGHADGFFARALAQTPLAAGGDGPRAGDRQLSGRQRRAEHGRAVRIAGVLHVPPLAGRSGERRAAHQRGGRSQPGAQSVQGHVRQGSGRDRARRRLSRARTTRTSGRPRSGKPRRRRPTSRPAGSAAISIPPGCRRPTCSTRSRSPTCCPKCWWPTASTWPRSRNSTATA